jgi:tetratricopeptide (TPR) repeat protein
MWARPEIVLLFVQNERIEQAQPHLERCRVILAAGEDWRSAAGQVARTEAVVAAAKRRFDYAQAEYEKALEIFSSYHVPYEEAETLYFWGRALTAAGDGSRALEKLETAIEVYRRCGAGERWIERAAAAMPHPSAAFHNGKPARPPASTVSPRLFRKDGEYWTIAFGGQPIRLKDTKGLHYIACLLRHPGTEFAAVALANKTHNDDGEVVHDGRISSSDLGIELRADLGDAGYVLDERAKADYRKRLRELREELEQAEQFNDYGRQQGLRSEIQAIADELKAGVGRGGIDRKAASHLERARSSISKRIKFAVKKILQADRAAGSHLSESIHTGYRCVYLPKQKVDWEF